MEKSKIVCESFEEEMVEKRAVKAEPKQLPRQRPCHVSRFAKAITLFQLSPLARAKPLLFLLLTIPSFLNGHVKKLVPHYK